MASLHCCPALSFPRTTTETSHLLNHLVHHLRVEPFHQQPQPQPLVMPDGECIARGPAHCLCLEPRHDLKVRVSGGMWPCSKLVAFTLPRHHERLGAESRLRILDPELVRIVLEQV